MHRIDGDGNVSNMFTEGTPGVQEATVITDDWLNDVQENLCQAIEADGTALVKGSGSQLRTILATILTGITPGGRLSVSDSDPTSTGTNASYMSYTLFKHNKIRIYNGTRWTLRTFGAMVQYYTDTTKSPAAAVAGGIYDVFVWDDAGTLRATRGPAWTTPTDRGSGAGTTELEMLDGGWVNRRAITNGPAARRGLYVGTFYVNVDGAVYDDLTRRHIWNEYNRIARTMSRLEATTNWTYNGTVWRQANNATANKLSFIRGQDYDAASARVKAYAKLTSGGGLSCYAHAGIGLDSTSAVAYGLPGVIACYGDLAAYLDGEAFWNGLPGFGLHELIWLEKISSHPGGNVIWSGVDTVFSEPLQSGLLAEVLA